MSTTQQFTRDRLRCHWCGANTPAEPAEFCAKCTAPQKPLGYLLLAASVLVKSLAIPLVLAVMTLMFTNRQQENARLLADREKLLAAYVDFGHAHSDYRIAASEILFLALGSGPDVPSTDLKSAVLKLDQAFDSIGAKLTPFEEHDRTSPHFTSPFPDGKTALEETWQNCFIHPYFTSTPNSQSYWNDITRQLQLCTSTTCPIDTAIAIAHVLDKIETGSCTNGSPAKQRNFIWFWNELRRVMADGVG